METQIYTMKKNECDIILQDVTSISLVLPSYLFEKEKLTLGKNHYELWANMFMFTSAKHCKRRVVTKLCKVTWFFFFFSRPGMKHTITRQWKKREESEQSKWSVVHDRNCSFHDLMILKITYEGINMVARGYLMLIQALHEHRSSA